MTIFIIEFLNADICLIYIHRFYFLLHKESQIIYNLKFNYSLTMWYIYIIFYMFANNDKSLDYGYLILFNNNIKYYTQNVLYFILIS